VNARLVANLIESQRCEVVDATYLPLDSPFRACPARVIIKRGMRTGRTGGRGSRRGITRENRFEGAAELRPTRPAATLPVHPVAVCRHGYGNKIIRGSLRGTVTLSTCAPGGKVDEGRFGRPAVALIA
jgi:hypothetical protein